ncbi:hypothetical protein BRADI_1g73576v3 [Brachypodium distachyon]|uniref:Uncharacterized protein n=1 Tax=Brachypodium distachyon TaxID=15368 RepID=A0A0Q3HKD2_BRADI|nr:hypothetical protein BRADI_1g73576v3 [Brachypodium distachyon]
MFFQRDGAALDPGAAQAVLPTGGAPSCDDSATAGESSGDVCGAASSRGGEARSRRALCAADDSAAADESSRDADESVTSSGDSDESNCRRWSRHCLS